MARTRDFGSGTPQEEVEPLSFTLHGEEFVALPELQGTVLINLVKNAQSDDAAVAADVVTSFFERVLVDESLVRFKELINSKDKIVKVETLGEIVGWLTEEYTNRPEGQPGA